MEAAMSALTPILLSAVMSWLGDGHAGQLRPPRPSFSGQQVDYIAWYNDFVRQGRPEDANAFPLYDAICPDADHKNRLLRLRLAFGEEWAKLPEGPRVWTAGESAAMAAYVDECKPYFDIVQRALERKSFWI